VHAIQVSSVQHHVPPNACCYLYACPGCSVMTQGVVTQDRTQGWVTCDLYVCTWPDISGVANFCPLERESTDAHEA
jgi:hypothetical protein